MASSSSREHLAPLLALLLLLPCISTPATAQPLASSEAKALYRVRRLLFAPPALAPLTTSPDPCLIRPTPSLTITCSGGHVTSLSILGDREPDPKWRGALPSTFSADALFTTLTRLPSLSGLSLVALGVWGPLPGAKLLRLASLRSLNLTANYLYGAVPAQLARMSSLQTLVLSRNWLNGTVPSLTALASLAELDLGSNRLDGAFPEVPASLATLVLSNNNFTGKIPASVAALAHLSFLDVSRNRLAGWIPSALFALPALRHLDLSHNQLTGQLPPTTACADTLEFVDLSANLLVGPRPACLRSRAVLVAGNCFADATQQRPSAYCSPAAIAASLPPTQGDGGGSGQGGGKGRGVGVVLGIVGAVVGGALLVALVLVVVLRRARRRHRHQHPEVMYLPKSPLVMPAKKADDGKSPAKVAQHKIATTADKSKTTKSP
jgi:hypothetical protein